MMARAQLLKSLLWLRRDLRCNDHRAWSEAERLSESIAVCFVFDTNILDGLPSDDRRITFIYESLAEVKTMLEAKGSTLIIRYGDPVQEIPRLVKDLQAEAVFSNRDYEPYARQRDAKIKKLLEQEGIEFYSFKDHVIFEADEIKTQTGLPYKVFTPYAKAWRARLSKDMVNEAKVTLKKLRSKADVIKYSDPLNVVFTKGKFLRQKLFLQAGRKGGLQQLKIFEKRMAAYEDTRNYPASDGTSRLSTHLRFGTLNIRELFRAGGGQKSQVWQKELIWREFYQMLIASFPQLPQKCFQSKCDAIIWPGTKKHFKLWCDGKTGYPLIDAAMRHLNRTGWMHNRLRMVVASFLTKDLLCDWKWGENYFAEKLLDFELASNNGGWQWAASVGCDAQPYFRIFNPVLQSERFDPSGAFIKDELPELAQIPPEFIHAPWRYVTKLNEYGVKLGIQYPRHLVDHAIQKEKAIALFRP